jgi:hypothetical protein
LLQLGNSTVQSADSSAYCHSWDNPSADPHELGCKHIAGISFVVPFFSIKSRNFTGALLFAASCLVGVAGTVNAAEFGSSPYPRGFRDIFAGVVPSVPGLYVLNDVYHYAGNANALVFNGAVQLGVEAKFTADFLPITYVTKWKILGGTYAFSVAPAVMSMDTDVGLTVPNFTGPLGRHFGPFSTIFGDTETNVGDTGLTPITLGWHSGNFYWAAGVAGFCANRQIR